MEKSFVEISPLLYFLNNPPQSPVVRGEYKISRDFGKYSIISREINFLQMENFGEIKTAYLLIGLGVLILLGIIVGLFFLFRSRKSREISLLLEKIENSEEKNLIRENERLKNLVEQYISEQATLKSDLENLKEEKNKLEGTGKATWAQKTKLEEQLANIRENLRAKEKELAKFQEEVERRQKEFETQSKNLENARKHLEEEKIRIQREDEEAQQKILEEKNRKWNDHENEVIYLLKDVCKKPELDFTFFDNTNLPVKFDGRLKPDFMIEFLGQYIIFDAKKSSKPENIKTYIAEQVKKSAEKYAKNDLINSQVFFVVPQEALQYLPKLHFFERGFHFFIITKEAIEPILFNFKRITEYENIEQLDPQERENIVDLIAHYDRHISFQNAANIILAKESIPLMKSKKKLNPEIQKEIEIKKQNIREKKLMPTEVKRISNNLENQDAEIEELTSTKPLIAEDDLENAEKLLDI